ncbi:MAG TPA: hypothetical protein VFS30_02645 [Dehalococcoidia bacterium]|nr:hypothetical protein [Dehalococcoidia bacterium]
MLRNLTAFVALFFILAAVACGGDDDSNSSSPSAGDSPAASSDDTNNDATPAADDSDDTETPPAASGGGVGVVEANGQTFDVREVRRCEPFFEGEDNLDLQALASDGVILFVVINTPLGSADQLLSHELSIQGSALGSGGQVGAFSGTGNSTQGGTWLNDDGSELSGAPFTLAGDRISGSMAVTDARGGPDSLDVTFDIPIPSEIIDC